MHKEPMMMIDILQCWSIFNFSFHYLKGKFEELSDGAEDFVSSTPSFYRSL